MIAPRPRLTVAADENALDARSARRRDEAVSEVIRLVGVIVLKIRRDRFSSMLLAMKVMVGAHTSQFAQLRDERRVVCVAWMPAVPERIGIEVAEKDRRLGADERSATIDGPHHPPDVAIFASVL